MNFYDAYSMMTFKNKNNDSFHKEGYYDYLSSFQNDSFQKTHLERHLPLEKYDIHPVTVTLLVNYQTATTTVPEKI